MRGPDFGCLFADVMDRSEDHHIGTYIYIRDTHIIRCVQHFTTFLIDVFLPKPGRTRSVSKQPISASKSVVQPCESTENRTHGTVALKTVGHMDRSKPDCLTGQYATHRVRRAPLQSASLVLMDLIHNCQYRIPVSLHLESM